MLHLRRVTDDVVERVLANPELLRDVTGASDLTIETYRWFHEELGPPSSDVLRQGTVVGPGPARALSVTDVRGVAASLARHVDAAYLARQLGQRFSLGPDEPPHGDLMAAYEQLRAFLDETVKVGAALLVVES